MERAFLFGLDGVTEVLLIRHAQQDRDLNGPVGGFRDPPLSEQGREQARMLGEALSTVHLDAVFSSGLKRARETAAAVAAHHQLEPNVIEDLREIEIFRDMPPDQTALQFFGRELLRALQFRMIDERSWDVFPYTEPSHDFRKRVVSAVEQAIASQRAERIAVVCHGGVINTYVAHVVGSPYDFVCLPTHTSVSVIAAGEGQRVLRSLNDNNHLHTGDVDLRSV